MDCDGPCNGERFWVERPADLFRLPSIRASCEAARFNDATRLLIGVAIVLAILRVRSWHLILLIGLVVLMFVYYNRHPHGMVECSPTLKARMGDARRVRDGARDRPAPESFRVQAPRPRPAREVHARCAAPPPPAAGRVHQQTQTPIARRPRGEAGRSDAPPPPVDVREHTQASSLAPPSRRAPPVRREAEKPKEEKTFHYRGGGGTSRRERRRAPEAQMKMIYDALEGERDEALHEDSIILASAMSSMRAV